MSFEKLRTYGAFLISAKMNDKKVDKVIIQSTAGGTLKIQNPFKSEFQINGGEYKLQNHIIVIQTMPNQIITLSE